MKLTIINTVSKKEYSFSVTDLNDSRLFYHFKDFRLEEEIENGSYNYFLYDEEDKKVAEGLLQIGDFENNTAQYEVKNGYKQYNG